MKLMKMVSSFCIAYAVVLLSPSAVPNAEAQDFDPDDYGTNDANYHYISGEEFQSSHGNAYYWAGDGFWAGDTLAPEYWNIAPLRLPSGALVDGYWVVYDDSDAVWDLEVELNRYWVYALGTAGTEQIGPTFTSTGTPGIVRTWVDLDPDITIAVYRPFTWETQSYAFKVRLQQTVDLKFRGIIVRWKRQVSAAPYDATFADVPTNHPFFQHIEALANSGITVGCGGGNFCPSEPVTRGQIAVLLAKALGLHWAFQPYDICRPTAVGGNPWTVAFSYLSSKRAIKRVG